MKLFAGGAEVPGWRTLLAAERAPAVSLSFVGLSRRVKHLDAWLLADKFPADPGFRQELFLDSGAYSLNKDEDKYTDEQVIDLWVRYKEFLAANLDRIDVFSEFDVQQMDGLWRMHARDELQALSPEKFMPIWHASDGLERLDWLAEHHDRVGILQPPEETVKDLSPVLRKMAAKTRLHGVAMTRMAAMKDIPWDSVGSTSWLSPGQWGDTFVWVEKTRTLKRYPVKYREKSRHDHRKDIEQAGFDAVAIARDATEEGTSDDRKEVLRLSLWSWGKFVEDINRRRDERVTQSPDSPGTDLEETGPRGVDQSRGRARNGQLVPVPRQKTLLPLLSLSQTPVKDSGDGTETEAQVGLSTGNLMRCDTCFARDKCPAMQPGAECAYEIPMVIRTTTQARALRKTLLGMQGQRVMFMRLFEQLEGGYADPNLSAEIRTLQKMLNDDQAAEREHASIEIKVTSDGNSGMISRIFGGGVEQRVNALPEPIDSSRMLEASAIFEAEVVEE